jgi:hypothetical protein
MLPVADDGGWSNLPLCELVQMALTRTAADATLTMRVAGHNADVAHQGSRSARISSAFVPSAC